MRRHKMLPLSAALVLDSQLSFDDSFFNPKVYKINKKAEIGKANKNPYYWNARSIYKIN
jgi:hypothetical protein